MRVIVLIALPCVLASCERQRQPAQPEAAGEIQARASQAHPSRDTAAYAVLPFDADLAKILFPNASKASLSSAELDQIDNLLGHCIAERNQAQEKEFQAMVKKLPDIALNRQNYFIKLPNYRRQVMAAVNAEGQKVVWVNCFCQEFADWRKQAVFVDDGGNCFFNLKINLATSTCYDVMVNGSA